MRHTKTQWKRHGKPRLRRWKRSRHWWKVRTALILLIVAAVWFGGNIVVHIAGKPTEILSLLEDDLPRRPAETWRAYYGDFCAAATEVVPASLLAAIAQAESGGRTWISAPWSWRGLSYGPPSSANGLLQFTKATFDENEGYCIRDGKLIQDNGGFFGGCWFNGLRSRMYASSSIEVAAVNLHRNMLKIWQDPTTVPLTTRIKTSATIHLCGPGVAIQQIKTGRSAGACGNHSLSRYQQRVRRYYDFFAQQKPCP